MISKLYGIGKAIFDRELSNIPILREQKMILANRIRKYVLEKYITYACNEGKSTIAISAGTVHAEMGLSNRMPAVNSAVDADKFLRFVNVHLVKRSGPHQRCTAEWVFALSC
jgi:hypothetical protein